MLILSRRCGERIFIGSDIIITIRAIDRNKVRVGIEAPRNIPVYREELLPVQELPCTNSTPPT